MEHPPLLVLGLGNPGPAYRATRHNLGCRAVERLAARAGIALEAEGRVEPLAVSAEVRIAGRPVVLARPLTFMNRAGRAAAALCLGHAIPVTELVVVYDDADLALGRLRVRRGGGAGGHNGVLSLFDELGTGDFTRVRLGVRGAARDAADLAAYVLSEFEPAELPVAERLAELGADAVETLVRDGLAAAMNRYNGASVGPGEG